jgi:hypothetical protein
MNVQAERHLAKAEGYLAKGEGWYRKAAVEMRAAKNEGATWVELGDRLGKSKSWCEKIVAWAESPAGDASAPTPFAEPGRETTDVRGAKRVLAEAPLEQIEQIISGLSKERQQAIGAAAGHGYLAARQTYDETERNLTPAEKQEREAASESLTQKVREATGGFLSLGIAGHLEQATEELRELDSPTQESMRIILAADADWHTELQVKAAMVDLEYERIEV